MKKKILLLLACSLLLTGCGTAAGSSENPASAQQEITEEYLPLDQELEQARQVKLELGPEAQALSAFAADMEQMRDQGLEFLSYGMPRQAAWCFAFVGGSVSALRYGADLLLKREPIGFAGWDTVGAISYATPAPFLCEALVAEHTGDSARAEECRKMAQGNPFLLKGMDDLAVLTELSDSGLKELAEGLIAFENHIYWFYPADPQPEERSGYEWSAEYHLDTASFLEGMGQQELATQCYLNALTADPFNPDVFALCALHMYNISNVELMQTYIQEGLLLDPEHGTLNVLAALLWSGAGETELAREYLEKAGQAELSEADIVIYEAVAGFLKEG